MRRVLCAAALTLLGCGTDDLTQIMVVVGTDVTDLDGARVSVSGLGIDEARDIAFASGRPATLALVHREGALGPVTVTARGLRGGAPTDPVRSARVTFVEGEVRMLRLDLLRACVSNACPSDATCTGPGRCVAIDEVPLEPWTGMPGDVDAGVPGDMRPPDLGPDAAPPDAGCEATGSETCNGLDDDCDDVIDEGFDLASDPSSCGACDVMCSGTCEARVCSEAFAAVGAGDAHSCATDDGGAVYCWGANDAGQLGDGSTTDSDVPVVVMGLPAPAEELALGAEFSCARLADGSVWCWGADDRGQRGDGPPAAGAAPTEVVLPMAASALTAGAHHACAVAGPEVRCWGADDAGQVGDGMPLTDRPAPELVALGPAATHISAGLDHTCARLSNGDVYCWGSGSDFQLGSMMPSAAAPVRANIPAGVGLVSVRAGSRFTCALANDATAWCWGRGADGQIGNGSAMTTAIPRQVDWPREMVWLDAGGSHACAVTTSGQLGCWGSDARHQLGDPGGGSPMARSVRPQLVPGVASATRVATGSDHTCMRTVDDSVACWGRNDRGQLGDGSGTTQATPVTVAIP